MNYLFYAITTLSLFILLSLFIPFSNSQSLDYQCFYDLANESGSLDYFQKNSDGITYNFCNASGIILCNKDEINQITMSRSVVKNSSFIFKPSNFDCFNNLNSISIFNISVSSDFIYHTFKNLNSLVLNGNDQFNINNYIPTISFLQIEGARLIENLNLKYFANVLNLYIYSTINSFVNDGDKPINNLSSRYLNLKVLNYPNLTNIVDVQTLVLNFDNGYNVINTSNILTYINISTISISFVNLLSCNKFPGELPILKSNSLTSFSYEGCIEKPNEIMNLSKLSKLRSSLTISFKSVGNFCYGVECYFPFSSIGDIIGITFTGCSNSLKFSNPNIFNGTGLVYLQNNKIQSLDEIKSGNGINKRPYGVYLDNNELSGTIDSSWCSTMLSVQNNNLTGEIPTCFKCYFSDSLIKVRFIGNNFTNFETTEPCTTIVPSLVYIENGSVYISGTDLIILKSQVTSNPPLTWAVLTPSKLIYADLGNLNIKTIDLLILNTYKFTLSLVSQGPLISNITYTSGTELIIKGSYFTYDKSLISFKVGNIDCVVQSTTFYEITCSFDNQNVLPINKNASLIIGNYAEIKLLLNSSVSFINQMCEPSCNEGVVCNMITSKCEIINHYVSGISSTTIEGGLVELYGEFGYTHNSASVVIGNLNCDIITITTNNITCNLPPTTIDNSGTFKNVIVIQNSIKWEGLNYFKYSETIKQCPKNCIDSNHGICNSNTGSCNCNSKWSGLDCAIPSGNTPQSNTTVNPSTGGTTINNQNTNYHILITSINELDFQGNIIKSIQLEGNWLFLNSTKNNQDGNPITYFSQMYNNNQTVILSTIEEVTNNNKQFSFAGIDFQVEKGSIKFTISIQNWLFNSTLNTLRLEMKSTVDQYNSNCQHDDDTNISINGNSEDSSSSNLNYMTISKGDKIMYGRFIDKAISDSKSTFIKSQVVSQDKDSLIIGINLPHGCCSECIVDPDFSVLTDTNFSSNCSNSRKWLIPVAVIVPIIGLSIIIIIVYIIYKKNSTVIKVHLFKLTKLKNNK